MQVVFTRSGKLDFDAISNKAARQSVTAADADDEKREAVRASLEETKKNQGAWLNPVVATNLVADLAQQKALPGKPLIACGGYSFARDLIKHDLIDEYRLVVHPVALSKGHAIFDGLERMLALKLVKSSAFPSGATARVFAGER